MTTLTCAYIETPLGTMVAMADEHALHRLEFTDDTGSCAQRGENPLVHMIRNELNAYFKGKLKEFETPIHWQGTAFQQSAWQALCKVPFGQTRSYGEQAKYLGKPTAFRAVANANNRNPLAIIVPCHRIVYANGGLGGYAGGIAKKEWLLKHEREMNQR